MDINPRQLARNVLRFGSGEFLSRLLSVSVPILLGHLYGVVIVGVYGLAVTLSGYLIPVIDFGLKHVGARLLARFPHLIADIIRRVQRRRYAMAFATLPLVALYAAFAHLALPYKLFLFAFSAVGALYALSLDWAAWGREHLLLAGSVKAIIPACLLLGLFLGWRWGNLLAWLVVANLVGYVLQGVVYDFWRRRHAVGGAGSPAELDQIGQSLLWRNTRVMGMAWFANLAFNNIDMLMLGILSRPEQVGLYGASYRILNQFLMAYYMLTGALFPPLSRQDPAQRRHMLRLRIFVMLFAFGCVVAAPVIAFRRPLLAVIFGRPFVEAAPLLLLLACCIPLDYLTSYLSNAYFAWNMERSVLVCALLAAGTDIVLNLYGIPRYGAMAAAVNTLISYVVYLGTLALASRAVLARE